MASDQWLHSSSALKAAWPSIYDGEIGRQLAIKRNIYTIFFSKIILPINSAEESERISLNDMGKKEKLQFQVCIFKFAFH